MKKIVRYVGGVLASLCLILTGCNKSENDSAIGIIGGADGPTAIYVATNNNWWEIVVPIVVVILIIIGLIIYFKKRKRK